MAAHATTVNLRRGVVQTQTQTTYPHGGMQTVNQATVFKGNVNDVIWHFAGLSSAAQRRTTTSRTVIRYSRAALPSMTGRQPPMSTHSAVQHWTWAGHGPKIHIHLRDSYAVPIAKYEQAHPVNASQNPNDDRHIRTSEYVLLPGTLSISKDEVGSSHMVHRSDQYIACARTSAQSIVVAVDATLEGAFQALVAMRCQMGTTRFILPTRKPKPVQTQAHVDRFTAGLKRLALRVKTKLKGAKRAHARAALVDKKAVVINLT